MSPQEQEQRPRVPVSKKAKSPSVRGKVKKGVSQHKKGGSVASPSMYWMVTDNQPGRIDHDVVLADQSYKVYQLEQGEEGHPHYQIYVEFTKKKRFNAVQRLFEYPGGGFCHIEKRRGTRQEAREYCMKDESRLEGPWESGEWTGPKPGQRNDFDQIRDLFKEGKSVEEVADLFPGHYTRYPGGIQKLGRMYSAPLTRSKIRDTNIFCTVFVGPAGVGKDLAIDMITGRKACVMNFRPGAEWYDAYTRQTALHVQEYSGQLPWESFLLLFDPSDQHVPVKCAMAKAEWKEVYFSSNTHPYEWYPDPKYQRLLEALIRRITILMVYDEKNGDFKEDMKHREARNRILKRTGLPQRIGPPKYLKPNIPQWLAKLGLKTLDEDAAIDAAFSKFR